jgi:hypothetical protein
MADISTTLIFFVNGKKVRWSVPQRCESGSGRIRTFLVPDVRILIRIRNLALINDPISTFLVCVKARDTSGISVA